MSKKKLTQKRLKELLHYDPETGIFTRIKKVRGGLGENPNEAGSIKTKHDYRIIGIDNKSYKASRLAFLYMEGYFPENIVDHKNRIKSDDRYKNLRQVTQQCNVKNCSIRKNNKSGVKGVCIIKHNKKWQAYIKIDDNRLSLGNHTDITAAVKARWNAEVKYNYLTCQTTSSAYIYLKKRNLIAEV